jgi:3-oxoacyl-[acyl-carrier-protein] synthase III
MKTDWDEDALLELVRECVGRELISGSPTPERNADLVKSGLLDSMGWVGVLSALEKALGVRNFANAWPEGKAQSIAALVQLAREAVAVAEPAPSSLGAHQLSNASGRIYISGWGSALGCLTVPAEQIEAQYGLPAGTVSERAGIASVSRASETEDEISLGQAAANRALGIADLDPGGLDLIVGISTTFLELPSFAAALHNRLLLSESCTALDVGGACVALVNGLATAKSFLTNGNCRAALVVASEVHSRRLASATEVGEFCGLFGDGACAFVLRATDDLQPNIPGFRIGEFVSGCNGTMASALRVSLQPNGMVGVSLNGEALGRGAVTTLHEVIGKLESLSGAARSEVEYFSFHEPNPRLVEVLAQRAGLPIERFTRTVEKTGNLGSATCGVNLCTALTRVREANQHNECTIFVAAVGPGVLWSGTYIKMDGGRNRPS